MSEENDRLARIKEQDILNAINAINKGKIVSVKEILEDVSWLIEQAEKAQRYESALAQIIAWGPLGGIETAAAVGQVFQLMAQEALEGKL